MELRASELTDSDLPSALKAAARHWAAGSSAAMEVQITGAHPNLPEDVEQNVLRIAQEAVTNAVKHAGAKTVWIDLHLDPRTLQLVVRDDGRGFELSGAFVLVGGHFGLLGMRERAERLGGSLEVSSEPGDWHRSASERSTRFPKWAKWSAAALMGFAANAGAARGLLMQEMAIRILIAEDHLIARAGLIAIINAQPDMTVVAEANNGQQAMALYRQHRPDVTLMDMRMPGTSGYEAVSKICMDFPDARIVALSTYGGDEDIRRAFLAGVRSVPYQRRVA